MFANCRLKLQRLNQCHTTQSKVRVFADDLSMNDDVTSCPENWPIVAFVHSFCFAGEGGTLDFHYETVISACKIIFLIRAWTDYQILYWRQLKRKNNQSPLPGWSFNFSFYQPTNGSQMTWHNRQSSRSPDKAIIN